MVALDSAGDASSGREINGEEALSIWAYVPEKVARQGGPVRGVEKTDHFDKQVNTSSRLSPCGIPDGNRKRKVPDGVRISEYSPISSEGIIAMSLTEYFASPNVGG